MRRMRARRPFERRRLGLSGRRAAGKERDEERPVREREPASPTHAQGRMLLLIGSPSSRGAGEIPLSCRADVKSGARPVLSPARKSFARVALLSVASSRGVIKNLLRRPDTWAVVEGRRWTRSTRTLPRAGELHLFRHPHAAGVKHDRAHSKRCLHAPSARRRHRQRERGCNDGHSLSIEAVLGRLTLRFPVQ